MPIYKAQVAGSDQVRIVKAPTAAQAKSHLVDVKPMTATELADAMESGAEIETASTAD